MLRRVHKVNFFKSGFLAFLILFISFCIPSLKAGDSIEESPIKIFAGYDERQPTIGTYAFVESVYKHASKPIEVTILNEKIYEKNGWLPAGSSHPTGWDPKQMSPFGRSRFLVPHLSQYKEWSLFCDAADMMLKEDIANLWALRDDKYTVMVVKHSDFGRDHPEHTNLDRKSPIYTKFNWSSVMLLNNKKCKKLTPDYVKNAPYVDLHQFKWLLSEDEIGELPAEWNYLVTYSPPLVKPALIHWTRGSPCQGGEFRTAEFASEWFELATTMLPEKPAQPEPSPHKKEDS
ncbi:MAG: glycosyltransferase [Alphaproteobacteria bacterium]|nr:glycosyltransferase [Alphaproteobacteria bacterium]